MSYQLDKIAWLCEMMGGQMDSEVAAKLLEEHGWDVCSALNTCGVDAWDADGDPRAPMRTGYNDALMAPPSLSDLAMDEADRCERECELERKLEERRAAQSFAET